MHEALANDDLAATWARLQQKHTYGRENFRAIVQANAQRCAGAPVAHRPCPRRRRKQEVNLPSSCSCDLQAF